MLSDHSPPDDVLSPPGNPHAADGLPLIGPLLSHPDLCARDLPWRTPLGWLRAGWDDLWRDPLNSLSYGLGVFLMSALVVWTVFVFDYRYVLWPALAGFTVVGPLIANGLYEKGRQREAGHATPLLQMVFGRPRSSPRAVFMGVLLLCLFLLWMRLPS
ncbi:Predicted integral membrane protein [Loktanella fryxellensis]|uniref:Predicted integral membrane protein n=1 Tax=Loktanella fryxellensis TaxID=245187 RepID=A0A1H8HJD1_9RHOB|nr:DUF2189 domain-containing protein [Loktanella fryxellensis]SEN56320.1 Predicted integral membrane protein [Loktanella fryxellensis]